MVKAFEVGLPVTDILVIEPVNHMFAEDQVGQERVGTAVEEAGGNQVCPMDSSDRVSTADCGEHLIAQPAEVCLELSQHVGRGEVPRQRLVTVQHVAWIFLDDKVDRVEQALQVTLDNKRCTQVRHDEIADKEHAQIRQMDEHGVVRLSPMNGNQLNARSSDFYFGGSIDCCVRFEISYVIEVKALAEKVFADGLRRVDLARDLFLIIASRIETRFRIQAAKIGLSADVVPMGMRDEDGGELRQIRCVGAECFVGGLCGVGAGSRVYTD